MMKTRLALAVALLLCGCSSTKPAEPPANIEPVTYVSGFLPEERDAEGTFRWMVTDGVIRLRNMRKDMALSVEGFVPLQLTQPPTLTFELNGSPLGEKPTVKGANAIRQDVAASQQGNGDAAELHIRASQVFVPADIIPGSIDKRPLGFAIRRIAWTEK
jgi:hypothetical protein